MESLLNVMREGYRCRGMLFSLARNDFRTRFVGSYFGLGWAFAQPLATILLFWFVFQVGFRVPPARDGVPFVLWLSAGLAPWFFLAEAWQTGTNALPEYSYLVKKVVFRVELLPMVKVLSALGVHVVFVALVAALAVGCGKPPSLHLVQVIYYAFCLIALVLGLTFLTAGVMPFFRDLGQLLGIVLQFGMWLTPILWPVTMVPERFRWLFKLNPANYIVEGYRDAFTGGAWVWQHGLTTAGFWAVTLLVGWGGAVVFRRLKPHIADVL